MLRLIERVLSNKNMINLRDLVQNSMMRNEKGSPSACLFLSLTQAHPFFSTTPNMPIPNSKRVIENSWKGEDMVHVKCEFNPISCCLNSFRCVKNCSSVTV